MAQTTLRDYLQTTEDAISSGRIDDALANCQHMLTHFPEFLEAQRLLGEVYLAQGHFDEAQQTFDWVLTNDPENVVAYCSRALISEHMSDYDTALDCYQQAYELSRGNSQIRQEFNQLSAKVGQQGFIFSRAGLARLYMRGDLLPQAIQEWEIVLTNTPDRLDARTGLLEACWREGLYDRVEQLAIQILNEVPYCLKALLLLAHVTYAQNAIQAQELMQRARALDPDLVMAQELFSDYMVSQPKDPFLALFKIPSTVFPQAVNGKPAQPVPATGGTSGEYASTGANGTHGTSAFSDPFLHWSSLDTIIEPQQDYQPVQEVSPLGAWSSNGAPELAPWESGAQQDDEAPTRTTQSGKVTPAFGSLPTFDQDADTLVQPHPGETPHALQEVQENSGHEQQQPWYHMEVFEETTVEPWSDLNTVNPATAASSWNVAEQETELPAPPAWLDMLTKGERRQSSEVLPRQTSTTPPAEHEPPVEHELPGTAVKPPASEQAEAAPHVHLPEDEKIDIMAPPPQASQDDDESYSFGPEWLKSLGAATMESVSLPELETYAPPATPEEPAPSAQAEPPIMEEPPPATPAPPAVESTPETVTEGIPPAKPVAEASATPAAPALAEQSPVVPTSSEQPGTKQKTPVESWLEQAAQKLAQPDHNVLTTLEELENDLRSQGFMPLEPGTLTAIAQEPSLSSALAQLGNLTPRPANEAPPTQPTQPITPVTPPVEPLWATALTPAPVAQTAPQPIAWPTATPVAQTASQPVANQAREQVPASSSHLDALSSYVSQPAAVPTTSAEPEPESVHANLVSKTVPSPTFKAAPTPAVPPATPLDSELETTMKRPVPRLQPLQQRPPTQQNQAIARERSGERPGTGKAADGNTSYKERLLKGYQYQLAGAYDDAMQEYRIIIRNAPDLIGEVVSNLRALLKLAPKYSAGYRVLGDAYMRQGEYLQAMEAYNKALTIAKKAKS